MTDFLWPCWWQKRWTTRKCNTTFDIQQHINKGSINSQLAQVLNSVIVTVCVLAQISNKSEWSQLSHQQWQLCVSVCEVSVHLWFIVYFDLSVCQYAGSVVKACILSVDVFNPVSFYCVTASITQPVYQPFSFFLLTGRGDIGFNDI